MREGGSAVEMRMFCLTPVGQSRGTHTHPQLPRDKLSKTDDWVEVSLGRPRPEKGNEDWGRCREKGVHTNTLHAKESLKLWSPQPEPRGGMWGSPAPALRPPPPAVVNRGLASCPSQEQRRFLRDSATRPTTEGGPDPVSLQHPPNAMFKRDWSIYLPF